MNRAAGPSQRQLRVGEQLRHCIAETLRRGHFHDALLLSSAQDLTVSEVRVSPDLKKATAYVIALGGSDTEAFIAPLNDCAALFQKEFAHRLNLRFTPRLSFAVDVSFEQAQAIDRILDSLPDTKRDG